MFTSQAGNSIGIQVTLSNYLELSEVVRLSFLNKLAYKCVARAMVHKLQNQGLDVKQYSFDDDYQIYKLCSYLFSKNMLVVPGIEHNSPEVYSSYAIFRSKFVHGNVVKSVDFTSNYFVVQMQDNVCYVEYTKNVLPVLGRQSLELCHLSSFLKIEQVRKYSVNAQNFYYLTEDNQLRVRFSGHLISPKSENEMTIVLNAYQFKENMVEVVDFFLTESFIVIKSALNNLYLLDCANGLRPDKIANRDFTIFKIDFENPVRQITLSQTHMFILDTSLILHQICFVKGQLLELTNKYSTSKLVEYLILRPEVCKVMSSKLITKIYTNDRNLFIFEEQVSCKNVEDFDVSEVQEFLKDIQIKNIDKIILHNRIDGVKLVSMTEQDMERVLGLKSKSLGSRILVDEINIRKNITSMKPRLYIFGSNFKRQFNISDHLNYLVEVDMPNLDVNEQIKDIVVGMFNTIILTDKNRSFISVNNLAEASRRRLSSEYGEQIERRDDKPRKQGHQRKQKPKPKPVGEPLKKFEWLDFNEIICRYQKKLSKNVKISRIVSQGKSFYVLYGEHVLSTKDHLKYFQTVKDWLEFIRLNKNFDKDELLFLNSKDSSYYDYNGMLTKTSIIDNIKLVKKKSNNQILWSQSNRFFDIKANI